MCHQLQGKQFNIYSQDYSRVCLEGWASKQQRSIEPYPSKAVATVVPHESGAGSRQLGPSAVLGRLSLPKLKSLGRIKSNTEQRFENTLTADLEGRTSQMQHFAPTTSLYNCAMSTQAEKLVSVNVTGSLRHMHTLTTSLEIWRTKMQDGGVEESDHEELFDAENGDFLGPGKSNGEVGGPDKVDEEVDEGKTLTSTPTALHTFVWHNPRFCFDSHSALLYISLAKRRRRRRRMSSQVLKKHQSFSFHPLPCLN